jgi:hypothetical protein
MNMKNKSERPAQEPKKVVLLKDLAPRGDVRGGAAKIPFGAEMLKKAGGTDRPSRRGPP